MKFKYFSQNFVKREVEMSKYLKIERKKFGISQTELAEKLSVSLNTISNWELEKSPIPSNKIKELRLLGFDIEYVLTGERSMLVDRSTGDPPAGDALLNTLELIRKYTETAINLRKQELDKKD